MTRKRSAAAPDPGVLVQILLPVVDNDGRRFRRAKYASVRRVLTDRFGGVTIYSRAPAEGMWEEGDGVVRDDIVIFETMAAQLDRAWWRRLRVRLEKSFRQERILIRAFAIDAL